MSDSEAEEKVVIPMPKHRVKFTDMPAAMQEKAIRSKQAINWFLVGDKANNMFKLDKEVSTEIQKQIAAEPLLADASAGWHVIIGKNFTSAITYKTKYVCFYELLEGTPKSFLIFKTEWVTHTLNLMSSKLFSFTRYYLRLGLGAKRSCWGQVFLCEREDKEFKWLEVTIQLIYTLLL